MHHIVIKCEPFNFLHFVHFNDFSTHGIEQEFILNSSPQISHLTFELIKIFIDLSQL